MKYLNSITYIDKLSSNKVVIPTNYISTSLFDCVDIGSDTTATQSNPFTFRFRVTKVTGEPSTEQLYLQANFVNIGIQIKYFTLENIGDSIDLTITEMIPTSYAKDIVVIFTGVCDEVKYLTMQYEWTLANGIWTDQYIWKDTEFWQDN